MNTLNKILNKLLVVIIVLGFASCNEDTYTKRNDLFLPRLVTTPVALSNTIALVWYEVKDAKSYTIELHLDNYYSSLFKTIETNDPYITLTDLPYKTQFYIRIRSNAAESKFNSEWKYTSALTEPRPAFASLLKKVEKSDISETSAVIRWTVDAANPVDSISLNPISGDAVAVSRFLTETEKAQGYAEITGLVKSTIYNVNIYDTSKEGTYDKPYNQVTFRTVGPSANSIIVSRDADLSAMLVANDVDPTIPDGTEYYLPAGSFYKVSAFAMHKGFKLVGEVQSGVAKAQIEQIGWWNVINGSYIMTFEFENIDFYQTLASQYFFNANSSFTIESVSFYNCTFSTFMRGFWRHQGSGLLKHIVSLRMENCIIDRCGASNSYGTFALNSNGADNVESAVFKNCTFMRENVAMPNLFTHNLSEYPIHLEFRNITLYNYAANKQMINIDNALNSTLIIENMLIASPSGKIYSMPAGTVTSFASNYTTTDYLLGPSLVNGVELGISATDLFSDPVNGVLTIKDPSSPIVTNQVGDMRWLK